MVDHLLSRVLGPLEIFPETLEQTYVTQTLTPVDGIPWPPADPGDLGSTCIYQRFGKLHIVWVKAITLNYQKV